MNYTDDYRRACKILGCRLNATPREMYARFEELAHEWNIREQGGANLRRAMRSVKYPNSRNLEWAIRVTRSFHHNEALRRLQSPLKRNPMKAVPKGTLRTEYVANGTRSDCRAFSGKMVFLCSDEINLVAVDIAEKAEKWRFSSSGKIGRAVVADEIIYFGSTDGILYALAVDSGEQVWRYTARAQVVNRPAIGSKTLSLPIGKNRIHCIDLATGRRRWIQDNLFEHNFMSDRVHQTCCHQGKIYFSYYYGQLGALDEFTGQKVWSFDGSAFGSSFGTPVCADGLVIFPSSDGTILAFDAYSGYISWFYDKHSMGCVQPVIADRSIYDTYDEKTLGAFELETGEPVWVSPVYGLLEALEFSDGALYGFTTQPYGESKYVFSLDSESGRRRWIFDLNSPHVIAPASQGTRNSLCEQRLRFLVLNEGTPFFLMEEGTIYSLAMDSE